MMGKSFEEKEAEDTNALPLEPDQTSSEVAQLENAIFQHMDGVEQTTDSESKEMMQLVSWPLVDPLIRDLNPQARYYVHHFAWKLCESLVVYDVPGQNPMRDLIPATKRHPVLLEIILATSAFHMYNMSRDPLTQSSYQQTQELALAAHEQAVSPFSGSLQLYYRDALSAKQKALSLLAKSVASVDNSNIDLILVVVLFFINYDLIESGRDNWKVHMEGAKQIVDLLGTPRFLQRPMSRLRLHVLADFVVYVTPLQVGSLSN